MLVALTVSVVLLVSLDPTEPPSPPPPPVGGSVFITVRISSLADGSGATGVQWIEKVNDALTFWYAVEGTLIVSDSMSASCGAVSQSLGGFAPGGITPDQVTVR